MTKKTTLSLSMFALLVLLLLPSSASADTINLLLTSASQAGTGGSTLSFEATVLAPAANTGTIYLNNDSFNVDSPLVLDDSGFFAFPLSLEPGGSFTGPLFTIDILPGTLRGLYNGFFTIQGGADGATLDDLSTVNVQVNVTGQSTIPEPGSALLLATGIGGIAIAVRNRWLVDGSVSSKRM